jgi:SAM domain (Sterile alpha motif)/Adenylate and Guanylate cyclase catalytic domain
MDVVVWLRSLGLERYEAAFRENEIDERVLPSLTLEDLKEIGVGPVGHRRMLLEVIAALRADMGSNAPGADVATTSGALNVAPEDRAERRQVTVMFSDLVGSTALSARTDPEDFREVISAYQNSVAESVGRFGGFVAKYMGDGVLVYFGYPHAHEDDAERAVRAGFQLDGFQPFQQSRFGSRERWRNGFSWIRRQCPAFVKGTVLSISFFLIRTMAASPQSRPFGSARQQ